MKKYENVLFAFVLMLVVVVAGQMALATPVAYFDRATGSCIAVWDNNNMMSPCDQVERFDSRWAPATVSTPEQLSVFLQVSLSSDFEDRQELAQN